MKNDQILLHKTLSIHVLHIREFFGFNNHCWCLTDENNEDDLHYTPVVSLEKDRNSQTKNNNIVFMLNIVATFKEISLVLQTKLNIIV